MLLQGCMEGQHSIHQVHEHCRGLDNGWGSKSILYLTEQRFRRESEPELLISWNDGKKAEPWWFYCPLLWLLSYNLISTHLYSFPVFRGWWNTDSSWEQQPRKPNQGSLPVLHVCGSEGCLGTLDHLVSVIVLGRNHTDCQNYLQELLLSIFHDLVFNKLEHYVFPSLLFWSSSHCSRKAVSDEKIQVGGMLNGQYKML